MVMGEDSDLHCEGWGRPGCEEEQQLKCSDQPLAVPWGGGAPRNPRLLG